MMTTVTLLALAAARTEVAAQGSLHNLAVTAVFSAGGRLVALSDGKSPVVVAGDDFLIELDGSTMLSSANSSGALQPEENKAKKVRVRNEIRRRMIVKEWHPKNRMSL